MSKLISKIKGFLFNSKSETIQNIAYKIRNYRYWYEYISAPNYKKDFQHLKGKKKCIICLAADYGNLGDVAITYAQSLFLAKIYPEYEIVDFPISKTLSHLKSLKSVCSKDDIITLTGGGYMGDRYYGAELLRQLVIKVFKHNKIISFPQTAEFSDTNLGHFMLKQAQKIYSSNNKLEIWAREERSYNFLKKNFLKNKIQLTPDIVMTLNEFKANNEKRKIITLCLRDDLEKNERTKDLEKHIYVSLNKSKNPIEYYDTHIGSVTLTIQERIMELNKIFLQFSKSKLIITDRLHGMIIAYITGTPAIVLPNNNFKILECYKWIKDCGYIKYLTNSEEIDQWIEYDFSDTLKGFEKTHNKIIETFKSTKLN